MLHLATGCAAHPTGILWHKTSIFSLASAIEHVKIGLAKWNMWIPKFITKTCPQGWILSKIMLVTQIKLIDDGVGEWIRHCTSTQARQTGAMPKVAGSNPTRNQMVSRYIPSTVVYRSRIFHSIIASILWRYQYIWRTWPIIVTSIITFSQSIVLMIVNKFSCVSWNYHVITKLISCKLSWNESQNKQCN